MANRESYTVICFSLVMACPWICPPTRGWLPKRPSLHAPYLPTPATTEKVLTMTMAIPYPSAVHDPGPVAQMDIPPIDIEEQRDLAASEDMSHALAETQVEQRVDAGPQAAEYASLPETGNTAPENADSDTEEHPEDNTRPRRDRRPPLTFTYNQLGIPEY